MDPKVVLRSLIDRLKGEVGTLEHSDFAAWEGEEKEQAALAERSASGRLHLAEALLEAKEALASGDEVRIRDAALLCQGLERTGGKIAAKRRVAAGGARRGKQQTNEAERKYSPYVAVYSTKRNEGKSPGAALKAMKDKMDRDGVKRPSDHRLGYWIRKLEAS